ncbi:MAG: hypothetical protein KIT46_04545 [Anaerolineales bacterium]|nr:hypothetical protein [Anaerolineales bacterium]MCW5855299.1 hypothetical protein [Anaerolineales bacterium]
MSTEIGWLLDLYADERRRGLVLWLACKDGRRLQLQQAFPITFYATGDFAVLRQLWDYLRKQPVHTLRERTSRQDSTGQVFDVMAITVLNPALQPRLFREVEERFPQLTYFDCDLSVSLRYAAAFDVFPMSLCEVDIEDGWVKAIRPLNSRWEVFPEEPSLRLLRIFPDTDPLHERPRVLHLQSEQRQHQIPLSSARLLISGMNSLLALEDPDLILAERGDTWLFPLLRRAAKKAGMEFNPNRDKSRPPREIRENSYFSYGRVIYRGQQTHLFGRWHIDGKNATTYSHYGVQGAIEQAQVSAMPVQEMARKSPGSGITAMFTLTTLRRGHLVPYEKLRVESPKTLRQLYAADKGGLIYQPTLGLHCHVVQIDYSSMYPSIMALWNVSPETVGVASEVVKKVPEIDLVIDQTRRGVVAETLAPLLEKRLAIKAMLAEMAKDSLEYQALEARNTALKWLLVVCFGYQGYKNFREGKVEAHEAITAFSRDALLRTMRIVEELGFEVLHMYVDSLWIKRADERPISQEEVRRVLDKVEKDIGLPISVEARYKFVAFLPARGNAEVPVPNRYFGQLEDGSWKVRGTPSRRHDTPRLVSELEQELLECLGGSGHPAGRVQDVVTLLRQRVDEMRSGGVPLEKLVASVNISKPPGDYRVRSSAATAGLQMEAAGRPVRAGQLVRFVYVRGEPRVHAWEGGGGLRGKQIDTSRYVDLILRMAVTFLQPLGVSETMLRAWVVERAWYGPGPEEFALGERLEMPSLR